MQRTIDLSDEHLQELERLVAKEHRTLDELVQVAIADYVARRSRDREDWARRFDAFVQEVRSRIPPELTPEEIEAEITANWQEYRAEHAQRTARAARDAAVHAGGH